MRITILSSGSGGNALCIESSATCVYVDAGLRKGRLRERWQEGSRSLPTAPTRPTAAFLTHEHADHICGAEELADEGLHLYATPGTAAALGLPARARAQVRELAAGVAVVHGDLEIRPVSLPHDAADPVAYVISDGKLRLGIITDCGHPSPQVAAAFADCDALILETNHDRPMLLGGPYPERLKRRIASGHGHLSNEQAARLLVEILAASRIQPSLLVCAHLSKANNQPELALRAIRPALMGMRTQVLVASQDYCLEPLDVTPGRPQPAKQLSLGL